MLLKAPVYVSPIDGEGTLENVFFEEVDYSLSRLKNAFILYCQMYYFNNAGKRIVLENSEVSFIGNEGDEVSSNKTMYVSIDNPDFDAENPESTPKITIPMFGADGNYNFNPQTTAFDIVDYGFPTKEKVLQYFEGGTLQSPEIIVTNPIARGFVLNKFFGKGEPLGVQFNFV
jgi:hypothetical protein